MIRNALDLQLGRGSGGSVSSGRRDGPRGTGLAGVGVWSAAAAGGCFFKVGLDSTRLLVLSVSCCREEFNSRLSRVFGHVEYVVHAPKTMVLMYFFFGVHYSSIVGRQHGMETGTV